MKLIVKALLFILFAAKALANGSHNISQGQLYFLEAETVNSLYLDGIERENFNHSLTEALSEEFLTILQNKPEITFYSTPAPSLKKGVTAGYTNANYIVPWSELPIFTLPKELQYRKERDREILDSLPSYNQRLKKPVTRVLKDYKRTFQFDITLQQHKLKNLLKASLTSAIKYTYRSQRSCLSSHSRSCSTPAHQWTNLPLAPNFTIPVQCHVYITDSNVMQVSSCRSQLQFLVDNKTNKFLKLNRLFKLDEQGKVSLTIRRTINTKSLFDHERKFNVISNSGHKHLFKFSLGRTLFFDGLSLKKLENLILQHLEPLFSHPQIEQESQQASIRILNYTKPLEKHSHWRPLGSDKNVFLENLNMDIEKTIYLPFGLNPIHLNVPAINSSFLNDVVELTFATRLFSKKLNEKHPKGAYVPLKFFQCELRKKFISVQEPVALLISHCDSLPSATLNISDYFKPNEKYSANVLSGTMVFAHPEGTDFIKDITTTLPSDLSKKQFEEAFDPFEVVQ